MASGPFSLTEWRSGPGLDDGQANPNWCGRDNGIDRVVFRVFTNPDAMVAALQQGEIDAAHDIPLGSVEQLRTPTDIEVVDGHQGGFTELAMNGMAGGIGDGHPALQDLNVRHAIAHAIDRDVMFDRVVNLGLGERGTTMSPSADPSWIPDLADEQFTTTPTGPTQMLDEAGYLDTNGDGVREMPDGGRRWSSATPSAPSRELARPIREFVTGSWSEIGIGTEVDGDATTRSSTTSDRAASTTCSSWGWTPVRRPRPDAVVLHVRPGHDRPGGPVGSQRRQLVQRGVRRALRAAEGRARPASAGSRSCTRCCAMFYDEATYVVLLQDADMQAYRTDRFEGWLQQPAETGPVLFTNTSPSYVKLQPVPRSTGDGGAMAAAATRRLIAVIAARHAGDRWWGVVLGRRGIADVRSDERESRSRRELTRDTSSRKVLGALGTLVFVLVFNFFLFRIVNDDPVAKLFRGRNLTPEQIQRCARSSASTARSSSSSAPTSAETAQGNFGDLAPETRGPV